MSSSPRRARIVVEPRRRLERAQEHRGADSFRVADDVRAPVDPVRAVDVEAARWAEHRRVPRRLPTERVARRIVRRVRLRLDDHAADTVDEQRPADELRRAVRRTAARRSHASHSEERLVSVACVAARPARASPEVAEVDAPFAAAAARRSARSSAPSRAESPASCPCRAGSSAPFATRRAARRRPRPRRGCAARLRDRPRRSARARRSCRPARTSRTRGRPSGRRHGREYDVRLSSRERTDLAQTATSASTTAQIGQPGQERRGNAHVGPAALHDLLVPGVLREVDAAVAEAQRHVGDEDRAGSPAGRPAREAARSDEHSAVDAVVVAEVDGGQRAACSGSSSPMKRSPGKWKPSSAATHGSETSRRRRQHDPEPSPGRLGANDDAGPPRRGAVRAERESDTRAGSALTQRASRSSWSTNQGRRYAQSAIAGPPTHQAPRKRDEREQRARSRRARSGS